MTDKKKKSRKPDYRLKVLDKNSEEVCNDAGAAWKNSNGSISLIIAPGIVLKRYQHYVITLFPLDKE